MHNHVGHRWIKTFLRKIISILLVYSLFFTNTANASTLAGGSGWRVASTVANGIGVTVNGAKDIIVNGASKTVSGVANVTPTASQVGKFMGKNLGAAAVVGAVDLLLDGVDWVIDEGGKVTKKPTDDGSIQDYHQTYYRCINSSGESSSLFKSCQLGASTDQIFKDQKTITCDPPINNQGSCTVQRTLKSNDEVSTFEAPYTILDNPNYNPAAPLPENVPVNDKEGKPLTLVSLGQMVIDQAQEEVRTGNPAVPIATPVTQAAASAVVGEAATDETQARPITAELDKSVAIPTDETAVGEIAPPTTNPETGQPNPTPLSLEFPVFCSWAPSMCVLADKAQQAIADAREWVKNDENQDTDNEPPEIKEIDIEALDTSTFTGVAGCPAPIVVPISFGDGGETEISYEPICQLAEKWSFVAPLIGFLSGAMIIVGVGRKGEDGEI